LSVFRAKIGTKIQKFEHLFSNLTNVDDFNFVVILHYTKHDKGNQSKLKLNLICLEIGFYNQSCFISVLEFISSSDHQPLLMQANSSSFRSLPRRSQTPPQQQQQLQQGLGPQAMCSSSKAGHQTLPLKSNLKKPGQKLQWHEPSESSITRASLEELRV
jgi:hypothetical protein